MRPRLVLTVLLLLLPLSLVTWKFAVLDYQPSDLLPRTRYTVRLDLRMDGHDAAARTRSFLPLSDAHQNISDERQDTPLLSFSTRQEGLNRLGEWASSRLPDGSTASLSFDARTRRSLFVLPPELEVPSILPPSIRPYLAIEPDVQVGHPEILAALSRIGADQGPLRGRLQAIFELASGLKPRPFKGTTDALTALRLGESSCNGKSRLFVALARTAGIPTRLVGGLILTPGTKRTSHQWVEVWISGHWVPFCPTNGYFAELPANYLTLYRGDEVLFTHTADINFDYAYTTTTSLAPSPRALEAFPSVNLWLLFQRLGLPFSLLRTLLLLPLGALVVVVFRNVIGLPTYGTFLPALIAAAASSTGLAWGLLGLLLVIVAVVIVRALVGRLGLLHSPTLAILLATVTTTLLLTSLASERLGLLALAHMTMFPIAVLAITAERFYLSLVEQGWRDGLLHMGGTFIVILGCYLVMNSLAFQMLMLGFPELVFLVVAADLYLGRWVGLRLWEHWRFRHLLDEEGA